MHSLSRYSIGAKLLMLPGFFVLSLLIISAVAYQGLASQQRVIDEMEQLRVKQYKQALDISASSQAAMANAYAMVVRILESNGEASVEELQSYLEEMDLSLGEMSSGLSRSAAEERLGEEERAFYLALQEQAAVVVGGFTELKTKALTDPLQAASMLGNLRADYNSLLGQFGRLLTLQESLTNQAFTQAARVVSNVTQVLIVTLLAAVGLALVVSLLLRVQIIRSIRAIEQASIQLRDGDLTQRVRIVGHDEIARTAQAFNELIESFQLAVRQVAGVSASVGASAEELVITSSRVSESAASQAKAVIEVSATVEQMSEGVASISVNAEELRSSAEASLRGRKPGTRP
ncbi:methyl-accepting chemotaxis protein [Pseudomonas lalucatii]|nr:methyl-accepting chemotaxis protein [Pseudomonas lalucatii]